MVASRRSPCSPSKALVHLDVEALAVAAQQLRVATIIVDEQDLYHAGSLIHGKRRRSGRWVCTGTRFSQSFSACQWMATSTRTVDSGKAQQHEGQGAGADGPALQGQGRVEDPLAAVQVLHVHGQPLARAP